MDHFFHHTIQGCACYDPNHVDPYWYERPHSDTFDAKKGTYLLVRTVISNSRGEFTETYNPGPCEAWIQRELSDGGRKATFRFPFQQMPEFAGKYELFLEIYCPTKMKKLISNTSTDASAGTPIRVKICDLTVKEFIYEHPAGLPPLDITPRPLPR